MFFFMSIISLLFLQNEFFYDIHDILGAKDFFDYNLYTSLIKNIDIYSKFTVYFNSSMAKIVFSVISYNLIDM